MHVSITGRHVELTESLKTYVDEKLQHLKHFLDHVVDVHVVLSVEKFRQEVEVTIQANGISIHGSHETDDMYASIDGVVDKLSRQLKKYRAKMQKHGSQKKRSLSNDIKVSHRVLDTAMAVEELDEEHEHEVVHHEHHYAKPMSIDEAVMQFELGSKQQVMMFMNQDTDRLNVLYRKDNEQLGWIEPEA
ncbi:MAG: ribosome-associated translation inhibitor RaiA [Mariprofundaceae bacterium]|nr:ribosome-associated translation inhibitor RaiA [Mariprofundaceae bacterium]